MADGAWIGHGTGIRALARKKKKEPKRRERGGSEKADFRLGVHTSQQECAPQEKSGKGRGSGGCPPPSSPHEEPPGRRS